MQINYYLFHSFKYLKNFYQQNLTNKNQSNSWVKTNGQKKGLL